MPLPIPASAIDFSNVPNSDPGIAYSVWNEDGFLRISSGFTPGFLNFASSDYSQYLALLNEDF